MKFSLIICTYMRPEPLLKLLRSVEEQTVYPDEILIVDGSTDEGTKEALEKEDFRSLTYYKVPDNERGLTRQRNYGIERVASDSDVLCFLDDDIVLKPDYFKELLSTYSHFPEALGVGGYIVNEVQWKKQENNENPGDSYFVYDGWIRKDGSRYVLRKKLGLDSDVPPAHLPGFAHGRSVSFLPPSGKTYEVEQLMGGVSSFRKKVLDEHKFSRYFEGYGLYEDADFTLRISKIGKLYVNTAAQLYHYHEASGRPDSFKYGMMVIRNGWYIWRVKFPDPGLKDRLKWNATALLLTLVRCSNVLTGPDRKAAFYESIGRSIGWWSVIFNKPGKK